MKTVVAACVLLASCTAFADDWSAAVRTCVSQHDLPCARRVVEDRLAASPGDLEALTWRARLLGWSGQYEEAEKQYRAVLTQAPQDADVLLGLADVQLWRGESEGVLQTLSAAEQAHAPAAEVLSRRARALQSLHRTREAAQTYRELLSVRPSDPTAKAALSELAQSSSRHMLHVGSDTDTFSYTGAANLESAILTSRWNDHWTTTAGAAFYQRFGQSAEAATGSAAYRIRPRDWVSAGGTVANRQDIAARYGLEVGYGHGFQFSRRMFRGLDMEVRQRQMWFTSSRVMTFAGAGTLYFPKEWMLTVQAGGIRTRFSSSTAAAWAPSGFARLSWPLSHRVAANLLYGIGAENFLTVDQIGRFSAHTYGGGLRLRVTDMQEITCSVADQQRTQDRSQLSVGIGYGIRF